MGSRVFGIRVRKIGAAFEVAPGTAGAFCGRRPPKYAKGAAEFAAIRDAYFKMREEEKQANISGGKNTHTKQAEPCQLV